MKSKIIAFILWLLLGFLGVHKFYLHKWGMGVLYIILTIASIICTLGGFVFAWGVIAIFCLVDVFTLGTQVDNYNLKKQMKITAENMNMMTQGMSAMTGAVSAGVTGMATATLANNLNQQTQNTQTTPQQFTQIPSGSTQPNEGVDKVKQLTELKSLLDSGILSQEEFEAEKTKILNS